jgi:predicted nucleic acid-binding protein
VIVVDASVLAPALADDGDSGDLARSRLSSEWLTAPELVDLETLSVFRGLVLARKLPARRAHLALVDLAALPLERVPHGQLLTRCWELYPNLTVYDAAYVALAEMLDVSLVTGDFRITRAPGIRCAVELLGA